MTQFVMLYKKFVAENVFRLRDKLQQQSMLTVGYAYNWRYKLAKHGHFLTQRSLSLSGIGLYVLFT